LFLEEFAKAVFAGTLGGGAADGRATPASQVSAEPFSAADFREGFKVGLGHAVIGLTVAFT